MDIHKRTRLTLMDRQEIWRLYQTRLWKVVHLLEHFHVKQYLAIKNDYPDAILFYRMGDFYEMFFEDAETASRVLEITLTSRNKSEESPVPMCGVPHRAAGNYIARLIERGYKVAICDQMEDPATAKGLVKREVVRVITPGMIVDEEFLDARSHNFILAVARSGDLWGLAYLDISTGAFRATESGRKDAVIDEARRVAPKEILLPESGRSDTGQAWVGRTFQEVALTYLDDKAFDYRRGYERLTLVLLVMEKSRDNAILKTMGASAGSVMRIFVLQGLIIGLIGTALGAGGGLVLATVLDRYRLIRLPMDVYQVSYVPFTIQPRDFVLVVVVAVLICLVATIYPSRQASRLDPAEALRYQ